MFGIGFSELLVILVIAFLVLGPEKMIALARSLGQMTADFRRKSEDVEEAVVSVLGKIKEPGNPVVDAEKRAGKIE
ncbi:MAG: twin-arginine translocase TatA/TatE family subunit [Nitrospirae bacterium]|nr:twin-arginine translocase TatA/TatE family subunit [Nitrospirota bacterium]MBI3593946.1 twin-arginine translocase TatA/TatE family subunit [Nitrospirota bacterium]